MSPTAGRGLPRIFNVGAKRRTRARESRPLGRASSQMGRQGLWLASGSVSVELWATSGMR